MRDKADAPPPPGSDELVAALQKQITDLHGRFDQLQARVKGGVPAERLRRLERIVCAQGAVIGELNSGAAKSSIADLQAEIFELLKPVRADLDAPANEEANDVA